VEVKNEAPCLDSPAFPRKLSAVANFESRNVTADQITDDLQVEVTSTLEDPSWDQFLELAGGNHHLQSTQWAQLKSGSDWKVLRVIMRECNRIVGGVQVLHRAVRFVGRVGYASRGPVFAVPSLRYCDRLVAEIDRAARATGLAYLMIQPSAAGSSSVPMLRGRGYHPSPVALAPMATVLVDLSPSPAELLAGMRRSKRNAIKASLAGELNVRVGNEADLPAFHALLVATGLRQGFAPQPLDYFRQMWRQFSPGNHILLVLADLAGEPVAGELDIVFGDTLVSKRVGWTGRHGRLHPNERVVWEAMLWAKARGIRYYDMDGLDLNLARAILNGDSAGGAANQDQSMFKLGFGGRVVVFPENHEYAYGRLTGWPHRKLWLKFAPEHWRKKILDLMLKGLGDGVSQRIRRPGKGVAAAAVAGRAVPGFASPA
jgi:lipid II:glycine glycyltransferase (peptidoglycan interpeptide bridge formation enzyme)